MKIAEIIHTLEELAPLQLQESYDNSGLLCGNGDETVTGVLLSLDCIEAVVEEAIQKKCNLIVSHHPIIFSGLKKITGQNYIERTIINAIKNDIAIYAIHTNLDNVSHGVNAKLCEVIGLKNPKILQEKINLLNKLVTYAPINAADKVRNALFDAGAGSIGNYSDCSFNVEGKGTFKGNENSHPAIGKKGELHFENEMRIEVVFESWRRNNILTALKNNHPYEEVAYDIYSLNNSLQTTGSGMIAELEHETDEKEFLQSVKQKLNCGIIKHTKLIGKKVRKVAVCGGSGSFLLENAMKAGADVFITSDYKYHQYFDADGKIVIADVGHFESEQFTPNLLHSFLVKNFATFAVRLSEVKTNPVHYL